MNLIIFCDILQNLFLLSYYRKRPNRKLELGCYCLIESIVGVGVGIADLTRKSCLVWRSPKMRSEKGTLKSHACDVESSE